MSQSTTRPREIEAEAAAEAAANGDLPLVNQYKLQYSAGQYRVGVDPFFETNTVFGKGSIAGLYVDVDRGMLIYDFQVGDEYDPATGGDYAEE
jgi:hypothetical protein